MTRERLRKIIERTARIATPIVLGTVACTGGTDHQATIDVFSATGTADRNIDSTQTALPTATREVVTATLSSTPSPSETPRPTRTPSATPYVWAPGEAEAAVHAIVAESYGTVPAADMTGIMESYGSQTPQATEPAEPIATGTLETMANLTDEELAAALDNYFSIDRNKDEGHSLYRLGGSYMDSETLKKIHAIILAYGPRARKYIVDRAPLFQMVEGSVEGQDTVVMGLSNLDLFNEDLNRLGFEHVISREAQREFARNGLNGIAESDEHGNVIFVHPDFSANVPANVSAGVVFESADGKDRFELTNLYGYEQMVAGYHFQFVNLIKLIDQNHTLSSEEMHDIAEEVVESLLSRHFEFEDEEFEIRQRNADGTETVVAKQRRPARSCFVQDEPDWNGGDPAEQELMGLKGPVFDQATEDNPDARAEYGTAEENALGANFTVRLVAKMAALKAWNGDKAGLAQLIKDHVQGYPTEDLENGVTRIPGSLEISSENQPPQEVEISFWACETPEGGLFVATATEFLYFTPEAIATSTSPAQVPEETPSTEVPQATVSPLPPNNPPATNTPKPTDQGPVPVPSTPTETPRSEEKPSDPIWTPTPAPAQPTVIGG